MVQTLYFVSVYYYTMSKCACIITFFVLCLSLVACASMSVWQENMGFTIEWKRRECEIPRLIFINAADCGKVNGQGNVLPEEHKV